MAYNTEVLERKALEAITKYKLVFIHEVATFINISKATLYEHKLNDSDVIKEALEKNKTDIKAGLRKKWYDSNNAACQIALYKLIGNEYESDRINSQKTTIEHSGKVRFGYGEDIPSDEAKPEEKPS
jgi:hypothetical protein